jgi:RND family efflux transporter MFP subunit
MADEDLSKLKIDKSRQGFQTKKGKKPLYIIIAVALAVLIAVLFMTGVFSPAPRVEVASVVRIYPSATFTLLNASGYVVPQRKSAVAAKVTGRLVGLFVEEGSIIKKDQLLAQLENDDLAASRKQAQANLDVAWASLEQAKAEVNDAKASFEREKELLAQDFTAKSSFDAVEARYKKAIAAVGGAHASARSSQAALSGIDVSMGYTFIRAPFDAVVLTKNADIGDIVTPIGAAANAKSAVVTIADMASLRVEADVSESNIEKLKPGQPCEIQLDAIPERSKATVMVKVRFNTIDSRILPEMSAKVAFLSREAKKEEETSRIAVSPKAIIEVDGKKALFLVKQNKVKITPVTVGGPLGDMIEITGGATAGDKVVMNPPKHLKNNARIKIAE